MEFVKNFNMKTLFLNNINCKRYKTIMEFIIKINKTYKTSKA